MHRRELSRDERGAKLPSHFMRRADMRRVRASHHPRPRRIGSPRHRTRAGLLVCIKIKLISVFVVHFGNILKLVCKHLHSLTSSVNFSFDFII